MHAFIKRKKQERVTLSAFSGTKTLCFLKFNRAHLGLCRPDS
jgi:hypothetical protein